jgi:hypothetical protein
VFEVAACYAQVLGKKEIGGYPINETVAAVYRDVYGFALANPGHNPQYYSKEI